MTFQLTYGIIIIGEKMKYKMFVYGIFLDEHIRKSILGHDADAKKATALGWERILNYNNLYTVVEKENSTVDGLVLTIDEKDLATMDMVEGVAHNHYKRLTTKLSDGTEAFVYRMHDKHIIPMGHYNYYALKKGLEIIKDEIVIDEPEFIDDEWEAFNKRTWEDEKYGRLEEYDKIN